MSRVRFEMTPREAAADIRVGDWVRFQKAGGLVIGVVQYVAERPISLTNVVIVTDVGEVNPCHILEIRHAAGRQPSEDHQ